MAKTMKACKISERNELKWLRINKKMKVYDMRPNCLENEFVK